MFNAKATLRRIGMQVDLHTGLERRLPEWILKRVAFQEDKYYPNRPAGFLRKIWFIAQDPAEAMKDQGEQSLQGVLDSQMGSELAKQRTKMKELQRISSVARHAAADCAEMEINDEADELDEGVTPAARTTRVNSITAVKRGAWITGSSKAKTTAGSFMSKTAEKYFQAHFSHELSATFYRSCPVKNSRVLADFYARSLSSTRGFAAARLGNARCGDRMTVNRQLVPLKILMLLVHGGMAALYPYLTLHMRSIGLTFVEIGVIYAILPFVSAIGPAIGGAVADKIGNYKLVMIVCICLSIVTHLLMWFAVPNLPSPVTYSLVNVTSLNGTFPCGPEEVPHYLQHGMVQPNCEVAPGRRGTLSVGSCSSDCPADRASARICLSGKRDSDCFVWRDFLLRFYSDVGFKDSLSVNHSVVADNFVDEGGKNMTWITCLHGEPCAVR
ncbi:hypothetical protein BV898_19646 [Hypsibius exemplaris]|uniref:Major facilitator superfamily associated domain-containing protein n=1 Tax=Hypsibius exemplaris TaxID=2072580 RepID=A0A9X6NJC6_HYPEX|nr:hypothetical protein BV898_19646 [Hypsibius exemplaris]